MRASRSRLQSIVRWLLIIVVLTGMVFAAHEWKRWHEAYLEGVRDQHDSLAEKWSSAQSRGIFLSQHYQGKDRQRWTDYALMARDLSDYHAKLSKKYDQASLDPWLPVWPDPAAPSEPGEPTTETRVIIDD
jgi:hypothetical protein